MKNPERVDAPDNLAPVARTDIAELGAGSFRSAPEFHPVSLAGSDVRQRQIGAPVAALSLLGLFGLYMKIEIMGPQWPLAARMFGKTDNYLSGFERLGFYSEDLLINFILVPLAGALLAWLMSRPLRTIFFFVVTSATALLYFFQLRAYLEIGQYASLPLLAEAFFWAGNNPAAAGDYLSPGSVLKLGCFLLLLLFLLAGEYLFSGRRKGICLRLAPWHRGFSLFLALGLPASALLLLPFSYAHFPAGNYLNQSAVRRVLAALGAPEEGGQLKLDLPVTGLLEEFRRQSATPPFDAADPRVGAEKDADILLFVLETAPGQVLDLVGSGRDFPGVGRLYDRSFIGREHFSTYPYTSDALYSLLSGLYPQGRRRLLQPAAVQRLPGLMSALDPQTYVRIAYAPDLYGAELDDRMFQVFGADRTYYAAAHAGGEARELAGARANRLIAEWESVQPAFAPSARQKLAARLTLDLQALAQLKEEIVLVKKSGRRFCALFLPQIGHGPWLNLHGRPELAARGRDLALLQDRWLAEILDLLAANGWLDHTIVVFTADHGIRTRGEDPDLDIGKLSAYMLQVPFLIHAPQALQQPVILPFPTSHIDIAPTVLALLGETAFSDSMQGVPLWQRSAANRIFLLGSQYAGADGFIQNGSYFMHHLLSDAVFESERLEFSAADMLSQPGEKSEFVRRSLREAADIQMSIVRQLIREGR